MKSHKVKRSLGNLLIKEEIIAQQFGGHDDGDEWQFINDQEEVGACAIKK